MWNILEADVLAAAYGSKEHEVLFREGKMPSLLYTYKNQEEKDE